MGPPARAAIVALVSIGLLAGFLAVFASQAEAQSALLGPISLHVSVGRQNGALEVDSARIVYSGDRIRTDSTGQALITYGDGSTVVLDTESELVIEYLGTEAGDVVVRMRQTLGRAWYSISQSLSWRGRYEVHTMAMASVVRAGSGEFVSVDADGATTIVVTDGSVETAAAGVSVTVPAGNATTVRPGTPPTRPVPTPAPVAPTAAPTSRPSLSPAPTGTPDTDARAGPAGVDPTDQHDALGALGYAERVSTSCARYCSSYSRW